MLSHFSFNSSPRLRPVAVSVKYISYAPLISFLQRTGSACPEGVFSLLHVPVLVGHST